MFFTSVCIQVPQLQLTFCLMASILDRSRFPFLPLHPAENSGPRDVSAVNECFVPLLLSNINPGSSSRSIVACWNPHHTLYVVITLKQKPHQLIFLNQSHADKQENQSKTPNKNWNSRWTTKGLKRLSGIDLKNQTKITSNKVYAGKQIPAGKKAKIQGKKELFFT